jgi:hypothetical protein
MGLGFAILSYADQISIAASADPAQVADVEAVPVPVSWSRAQPPARGAPFYEDCEASMGSIRIPASTIVAAR